MQLTCTIWVDSPNTGNYCRKKTHRSCKKHESLSLHGHLATGRLLLCVSFVTSLKSYWCTAITTQNNAGNICIISQSPNRISLRANVVSNVIHQLTCKGKAGPLQAWSGPEGSRKLRFPDFMTTAQDGGKVVRLTHRPTLPPGNTPGTHFC
jgi:hypothetical protein